MGNRHSARPKDAGISHERALVVEPDDGIREALAHALGETGLQVSEARDGLTGWERFRVEKPDLVIAGFDLPGLTGLELLSRIRGVSAVPVLLAATQPETASTVSAVREGVDDVLSIPDDLDAMADRVASLVGEARGAATARMLEGLVIGRSPALQQVRSRLQALANLRIPVLFRGEAGTGRDHVARALLAAGSEDSGRLVRVTPDGGRPRGHPDPSAVCYLDGVEAFAPGETAHWADMIDASERGDADAPRRVLASTCADLDVLRRDTGFNEDLARRLSRFIVDLPPLRDRIEDIGPLARDLARRAGERIGRPRINLTAPAIRLLQNQSWPGNVREIDSVVEKLVAFAADLQISRNLVVSVLRDCPASVSSLRQAEQRRQREELVALLDETGGNLAEVARRLDLSRGAVIYRAQKFGLMPKSS